MKPSTVCAKRPARFSQGLPCASSACGCSRQHSPAVPHPQTDGHARKSELDEKAQQRRRHARAAQLLTLTPLLQASAALAEDAAATFVTPVDPSTYVPGPVEVGWQIYFGAAVGVFPFILGAYEFGKRILIQRRCENCDGIGLVKKGKYYKKCVECGGFFPWLGWKTFFTSTASPGNGGPLLQPRGQTSVLYKVPPPRDASKGKEPLTERQKAALGTDKGDGAE